MKLIVTPRMKALAALLASILIAACGLRSTNPSTETLTIYQDAPKMKLLDLGEPGNSPGDVYHFFAPLHSSPGGPVIGGYSAQRRWSSLRLTATQTWSSAQRFCLLPL